MEAFLILNGYEIDATVDIQEQIILGVASGDVSREQLVSWLVESITEIPANPKLRSNSDDYTK